MARSGYFHGDLRRALLDAGLQAARDDGPEGISVRQLARAVGVAPSAVYRHFEGQDELRSELAMLAQGMVADAMETEVARVPVGDRRAWADGAIAAVGTAYVRFAWAEPGLFRIAFRTHGDLQAAHDKRARGACGRTPYEQLERALDALVESGELSEDDRAGAEALAWSAVHGFAILTVEGPLRSLPEPAREAVVGRVVEMVRLGLAQCASGLP